MNISEVGAARTLLLSLGCAAFLSGCGPHGSALPGSAALIGQAQAQSPVQPGADGHAVALARGKVELEGGLLEVSAPLDGVVEAVAVKEGQSVKRGDVLVRLATDTARQDLRLAEAELAAAQARLRAQQERVAPAKALVGRMQEAARAGATDLQRSDDALQAQREAEAGVGVSQSELRIASERVAQSRLQLDKLVVRAAQDGVVLRIDSQPGARATAGGRPLLVLMPQRPLLVRAELNDSFLGAVKPGQRVSVMPDSSAAGQGAIEGRVRRINPLYGPSRLDEDNPARAGLRVVDCWIEFAQTPPLRVGQDVRVNFYD